MKINMSAKDGKTFFLEADGQGLMGKELNEKVSGEDFSPDLEGYEFEIKGASDFAGFTALKEVEGIGLKRVLLKYGRGMHKRTKREGKKKVSNPRPGGLRLRKTVRGKVISPAMKQVNLKTLKEGKRKMAEIFPEQNKKPEEKSEVQEDGK